MFTSKIERNNKWIKIVVTDGKNSFYTAFDSESLYEGLVAFADVEEWDVCFYAATTYEDADFGYLSEDACEKAAEYIHKKALQMDDFRDRLNNVEEEFDY